VTIRHGGNVRRNDNGDNVRRNDNGDVEFEGIQCFSVLDRLMVSLSLN
jgi:hypothetical protein